jgi:hypothetical protein
MGLKVEGVSVGQKAGQPSDNLLAIIFFDTDIDAIHHKFSFNSGSIDLDDLRIAESDSSIKSIL